MKKIILVCSMALVWTLGLMISEAKAQVAYGISIVRYNTPTRDVDGYSGTWLDYYAGIYYDPFVRGAIYRADDNETDLVAGQHEGWSSSMPAEVYLFTTNYVEGKTYCTYSTHFIRAYFYHATTYQWFDPARYSSFIYTGGNSFPGYPFSNYYYTTRLYRLGQTEICITIPFPSTPTPTQTPTATPTPIITPTPSPTPCPFGKGNSCEQTIISVHLSTEGIRPIDVTGGNNTATVSGCLKTVDNLPVPNEQINLRVYRHLAFMNTGGHIDTEHTGSRPVGKLDRTSGVTNSSGCFSTTYRPSHISGVVTVEAYQSSNFFENKPLFVGVPNLVELQDGENYNLIGATSSHPASTNHWGTQAAVDGLVEIADDYKTMFYGNNQIPENAKLHYNDMSLPLGGKFDLNHRWENTNRNHGEHREGINTDVRCCTNPGNIPPSRWEALNDIFFQRGSTDTHDETGTSRPHWHLRFLFGAQNSVAQRTPHSFVENSWEAIMDRVTTQAEWENWHTQIVQAKTQGPAQLLEKAKLFQQALISESEYVARHRTNAEFIVDVFWSHFFRDPTAAESQYWQNYLQNLPLSYNQQRKRRELLYQLEATTEFEQTVLGIVD